MEKKPDIVEVICRYVSLRRSGKEFIGLCPFHSEKTPSFTVNEEKGLFHCFGCQESGDVFDFLMKLDGLSFPEACRSLGVDLGRMPERPKNDPIREQAITLCQWANEQFDKAQSLLRLIGQRARLANALRWEEEIRRLPREWFILVDLSEDLQNPLHVLSLWESREAVENLLRDAEAEPLPVFPELTPQYRARVASYVRAYNA